MARKRNVMDGNSAAAHVSYAYSDLAAIYPITPSTPMAEISDDWANEGRKNVFGQEVQVTEMQSEAGAAGAVHGSLVAGALTTTYTASQGLLLMIPNLYKIVGEQLPGVFNVSARTIASHALSIFGDHSDVYACRQTGVAMLAEGSVQEVMDLTPVAHLAALEGRIPFMNFFDGFRTSHEIQKIETWDYETLKEMLDMDLVAAFRKNALNPTKPKEMGSAQNPDIFFQVREASNGTYIALPDVVEKYMNMINEKIGTNYGLFDYYGDPEATHVIVAMGSICETIEETVDYLVSQGQTVGLIKVHLYRPFSAKHLLAAIPETVDTISVLDRTKEPGAMGEPLYLDVIAALRDTQFHNVKVLSGRYGLSSKDTIPKHIKSVYDNKDKKLFTVAINDDVTNLSLDVLDDICTDSDDVTSTKFWGLGSDGTVGANKNSIKIIGNHTDKHVQGYFAYDSKKSGGLTISHLRFSDSKIRSTYLINKANFVACHNESYIYQYDMVQDLKKGGTFLLNCTWSPDEIEEKLPAKVKRYIAENDISFYTINATEIGKEIGLNGKVNTVLQSAFFTLADIIPVADVLDYMKAAAKKSYGSKGDKIVRMNYDAIDRGSNGMVKVEVPKSWKDAYEEVVTKEVIQDRPEVMDFINKIQNKVNAQQGDDLPVSIFMDYIDGATPLGTAAHERRKTAVDVPVWNCDNCIQCNRCAYVCPHAVIRPVAMNEVDLQNAPEGTRYIPMMGVEGMSYAITVSNVDCTGCGACAQGCPGKMGNKALEMVGVAEQTVEALDLQQATFDFAKKLDPKQEVIDKFKETTVKGSQFKQPLLEFSGACAGCGETPYAKLITQLFGDRMYIANATGCSSIWGNSSPSTPYTVNKEGKGPAWANSLFEDAAEFGYGMLLAQNVIRDRLRKELETISESCGDAAIQAAIGEWNETFQVGALNGVATDKLVAALSGKADYEHIVAEKAFLAKKSQWIFGGDGWAYDIGFGGLDHVIASGKDINIIVFDTEIYSNTGGQASKATPTGAVAKLAVSGKVMPKKDLASIAMSYGSVYVAQIAMGADYNQCIKAISEAESYPGPSIILAYAPCISHGIKIGMSNAQTEEERAVKSGYWHLFRYNPLLKETSKSAFILDSKMPTMEYKDFLAGEVRYNLLARKNPEKAAILFDASEKHAAERLEYLQKLVTLHGVHEEE
ncbi:MAG: pyruvate:ferredoxin (flavodoxin) oxidoreductase [Lachnospiraceae bacterium]